MDYFLQTGSHYNKKLFRIQFLVWLANFSDVFTRLSVSV